MSRQARPIARRAPAPTVTVDRGARRARIPLKAAIALAAIAALAAAGPTLLRGLAPEPGAAHGLLATIRAELGLGGSPPPASSDASNPRALEGLHEAVNRGDAPVVAAILARLAPGSLDRPLAGMTALMRAAHLGHAELGHMLLDVGADPNARGPSGRTALQYAVNGNHVDAARVLLDAGADVDAMDEGRLSPLVMAANRSHTELALLLIGRGADVNLRNADGSSALMDAAAAGNRALVEALLAAGADPELRHRDGHTAMDFAARNGHREVVAMLARLRGRKEAASAASPKKGRRE